MNVKNFACSAAVLLASATSLSAALSPARLSQINRLVAAAKTPEAPAVVRRLVAIASKDEKQDIAVAAFEAAFKGHPATLTTALAAAIQAAPEATERLVEAAMKLAPEHSSTVVRTAVDANQEQIPGIRQVAVKLEPNKAMAFDREIASALAARPDGSGSASPAALTGGTVIVTPLPSDAPTQVYAQPGADPRRQP